MSGQDGAYLAKLLLDKGYSVVGMVRRQSSPNFWRIADLAENPDFRLVEADVTDFSALNRIIHNEKPAEIYNLAAQSFVGGSFDNPFYTSQTCALGPLGILESIVVNGLEEDTKFYQASTSELFGKVVETPQNENTPFYPRSPYAVAKQYGHWITKNYRESAGLFACSGILFNHESPLRGMEFVTQKICHALVDFCVTGKILELGNISALRDWGHAADFVEAMYLILQRDVPDDYVISTGRTISVRDFLEIACSSIGISLDFEGKGLEEVAIVAACDNDLLENKTGIRSTCQIGQQLMKINPKYFRPAEVQLLCGDSSKAAEELGWKPKVSVEELADEMVAFAFNRRFHNGRGY